MVLSLVEVLPPSPSADTAGPNADPSGANDHGHTNPVDTNDVDESGSVDPDDVRMLIDMINEFGAGPASRQPSEPPWLDPNNDNVVSGMDVLQVINNLNRQGDDHAAEAEYANRFIAGSVEQPSATIDSIADSNSESTPPAVDQVTDVAERLNWPATTVPPSVRPSSDNIKEVLSERSEELDRLSPDELFSDDLFELLATDLVGQI